MSDDAAEVAARVIESFGRRVTVATADGATFPAELFGKRLTCVCGDEVMIRPPSRSSGDVAKVVTVAPRRTAFARTDSRGRTEPLAANLSLLAVIIAPEPVPEPLEPVPLDPLPVLVPLPAPRLPVPLLLPDVPDAPGEAVPDELLPVPVAPLPLTLPERSRDPLPVAVPLPETVPLPAPRLPVPLLLPAVRASVSVRSEPEPLAAMSSSSASLLQPPIANAKAADNATAPNAFIMTQSFPRAPAPREVEADDRPDPPVYAADVTRRARSGTRAKSDR